MENLATMRVGQFFVSGFLVVFGDLDCKVLIASVFPKPPLWDKKHSNRNKIDKYWKEISN